MEMQFFTQTVLISFICLLYWKCDDATLVKGAISSQEVPILEYDDGQTRVLNCPLGTFLRESCDVHNYYKTMWLWAAPTLVIALVTCLFLVLYFPGKYWCNCCGGKYQSPNMCWPNNHLPAKYSKGELFRALFLTIVSCVMCFAGCIWACTNTARISKEVKQITQHTSSVVQETENIVNNLLLPLFQNMSVHILINETKMYTSSELEIQQTVKDWQNIFDRLLSVIKTMHERSVNELQEFVTRFNIAIYLICILALLISLFGVLAGLCNWRRYSSMSIMSMIGILSTLAWLLTAYEVVSYFVVSGSCLEVHGFNYGMINVLQAAMSCNQSELSDLYIELYQTVRESVNSSLSTTTTTTIASTLSSKNELEVNAIRSESDVINYEEGNSFLFHEISNKNRYLIRETDVEYITDIPHYVKVIMSNGTENNNCWYEEEYEKQQEEHSELSSFTQQCEQISLTNSRSFNTKDNEQCKRNMKINSASFYENKWNKYNSSKIDQVQITSNEKTLHLKRSHHQLEHIMTTVVSRLTSCEAIINMFVSPLSDTCDRLVHSSYSLYHGLGVLALSTTIALFAYVYGAKRFIPLDQAYLAQYDEASFEYREVDWTK